MSNNDRGLIIFSTGAILAGCGNNVVIMITGICALAIGSIIVGVTS